jgi:hypothetical protein
MEYMDPMEREDMRLARLHKDAWHFTPYQSDDDGETVDLDSVLGEFGFDDPEAF